jgi:hypothetical protein
MFCTIVTKQTLTLSLIILTICSPSFFTSPFSLQTTNAAILEFFSAILPPSYNDSTPQPPLLREIFSVLKSLFDAKMDSVVKFEAICSFLQVCFHKYGTILSEVSVGSHAISVENRMLSEGIVNLLLHSLQTVRLQLSTAWIRPKEQGQGQTPFESKGPPAPHVTKASSVCLASMLSLLRVVIETCPELILELPTMPGIDKDDDSLYQRSLDSAIMSLQSFDAENVKCAIDYLLSMVRAFAR